MSYDNNNSNNIGSSSRAFITVRFEQIDVNVQRYKIEYKPQRAIRAAVLHSSVTSSSRTVTQLKHNSNAILNEKSKVAEKSITKEPADFLDIKSSTVKSNFTSSTSITDKAPIRGALSPMDVNIGSQAKWDSEEKASQRNIIKENEKNSSISKIDTKYYENESNYSTFLMTA